MGKSSCEIDNKKIVRTLVLYLLYNGFGSVTMKSLQIWLIKK